MQITYQKDNGYVFKRLRNTPLPYKIGEMTSMGWIVLNIEYQYKNKFYPEYKYNMLIQQDKNITLKKKQTIESCKKEFKTFMYCFIAVLLISFLKSLLGI